MIKIRAYEDGDSYRVIPRQEYGFDNTIGADSNSPGDFKYTFVNNEYEPVAVLGGDLLSNKVLEVWSIISDKALKHPISLFKGTLRLIEEHEKMLGLNRTQMTVRADFEIAHEWALRLGFTPEGRLRKFGIDGSDYYMYARVR